VHGDGGLPAGCAVRNGSAPCTTNPTLGLLFALVVAHATMQLATAAPLSTDPDPALPSRNLLGGLAAPVTPRHESLTAVSQRQLLGTKQSGKKLTVQVTGEQAQTFTKQMPEAKIAAELGLQPGPADLAVDWAEHGSDRFDMTFPITEAEFDTVKETLMNRASAPGKQISGTRRAISNLNFSHDFNAVLPHDDKLVGGSVLHRTNGKVPWTLSISLSGN